VRYAVPILLVVGLVGIVFWFAAQKRSAERTPVVSEQSNDTLQTDPKLSDDQNDEAVLARLRARGSDLSKPTDVIFYLYIPSKTDATMAASILYHDGYTPEVEEPLGLLSDGTVELRYSVVAHFQEAPSLPNLRKNRELYSSLAKRFHGEYDGWEAQLKP
jgi:Regulator of ribonuclease activity B